MSLVTAVLLGAGPGCRALTETNDDRRCRRLNAFVPDTARMRVGETRRFQAAGFHEAGPGSCVSTMRGGFTYTTEASAVASVGSTTGLVTAHGVGTTQLRARWRIDGAEYRGQLRLRVLP